MSAGADDERNGPPPAAVHGPGIFFVLLDADGKIAEVSIFYRTLPAGVALQRNLADALGIQPWELRTGADHPDV